MVTKNCIICGSNDWERIQDITDVDFGGRYGLIKCKTCGLIVTHPIPTREELQKYYGDMVMGFEYCSLSSKIASFIRRSSYEINPFKRYLGIILGKLLLKNIGVVIPKEKMGNLLDIGCGGGTLTGWMSEFGWDVYGTDTSKKACEIANRRGVKAFFGELVEAGYKDKYFDVVVMAHSLEHIIDPVATLGEVRRILKDDGLLIIDVPNTDSYDVIIYNSYWLGWSLPFHIWHFSKSTITHLLNNTGFSVKSYKYRLPKLFERHQFKKYIRDDNRIIDFPFHLLFFKIIGYIFSNERGRKYSDTIAVYAEKNITVQ